MEKSYNPFKMWGSWVGLFIGILGGISTLFPSESISVFYAHPAFWFVNNCNELGCLPLFWISTPIIYFLIGWGIHSLVRKLRG